MLWELVVASSNVFAVFKDSKDSPKWAFFIDAAVMLAQSPLGMTVYIYIYIV